MDRKNYGEVVENFFQRNYLLENTLVCKDSYYTFTFDSSTDDQEIRIGLRVNVDDGYTQLDFLFNENIPDESRSVFINTINEINGESRLCTYTLDNDGHLWARCDGFLPSSDENEIEYALIRLIFSFQCFLFSTLDRIETTLNTTTYQ